MTNPPTDSLWSRLRQSFRHRKEIDVLLSHIPSRDSALKERVHWLFDLIDWIRREGALKADFDFSSGAPQAARTRYLLQLLDRNQEWKRNLARILRSIFFETKATELFIQTGLSSKDHFSGEFINRVLEKFLPEVPKDDELYYIFGENFKSEQDFEWIRLLDSKTLPRIYELLEYEIGEDEPKVWNGFKRDAEKAILILSIQVQGIGLSPEIRERLSEADFQKTPFFQFPKTVEKFLNETDSDVKRALEHKVHVLIEDIKRALLEVHDHLDEQGVSVQIVYKIERLERWLKRISDLMHLISNQQMDPFLISQFLKNLIAENVQRKSIRTLLNQNFSLLSRKIIERAGETGEHYITRDLSEYIAMLKSALGGGVVTAFTTMIKFSVYGLKLTSFYSGIFAALNYSVSFLFIHFMHYTLGTKQSSLTAPALASKMTGPQEELIDEIINLIRSQFIAILGNVLGVVPVVAGVCWLATLWVKAPLLSPEKAVHTIHDFSILGPTPLFAFFTGGLLWLSSIFSGWVDNWFAFHRIAAALSANRRMIFIFGPTYSRAMASFIRRNVSGIAASISLGFLLGLTPAIVQFFGIGLDVRHVTLSSGALTAALMSIPAELLHQSDVVLAIAGVMSMGVLNVGVSFVLAFQVAIRAKKVKAPERRLIYQALFRRILRKPWSVFWPPKKGSVNPS